MILRRHLFPIIVLALLGGSLHAASPLGTAFTYQGRLTDGGNGAKGIYDLRFGLFNAVLGGLQVGNLETNLNVVVSNGLFTTAVDFGAGIMDGTALWIEIGVRTNGSVADFGTLAPRQPLTASPYALFAPNAGASAVAATATAVAPNSVTGAGIQDATITAPKIGAGQVVKTLNGLTDNVTLSAGAGLSLGGTIFSADFGGTGIANTVAHSDHNHDATYAPLVHTHSAADITGGTLSDARLSANVARLNGNQTFSGSNVFSGVVCLTNTADKFAGSFTGNGGGLTNLPNDSLNAEIARAEAAEATLTLNLNNEVASRKAADTGLTLDLNNEIARATAAESGLWGIAGNTGTMPGPNFVGTTDNQPLKLKVNSTRALRLEPSSDTPNFIGGFSGNYVQPGLPGATIGGGGTAINNQPNMVTNNGYYGTIAGGYANTVGGYGAFIGGGSVNAASGDFATIAAGQFNTASYQDTTVSGGQSNRALYYFASVGGGVDNVASGSFSTVAGGGHNSAGGTAAFVGGGGGDNGLDLSFPNRADGDWSVVGGGFNNTVEGATFASVIGGGGHNTINGNAQNATISGGAFNTNGGNYTTIGGGYQNFGGGTYVTMGGGYQNSCIGYGGTVGGGGANLSLGVCATVPGGFSNTAEGDYSFAAGRRAVALNKGAFVWADSTDADFYSTRDNQFLIRASAGVYLDGPTTSLFCGVTTRQMLNLWSTSYGIGVQGYTTYFRCDGSAPGANGFAWYQGGSHNDNRRNAGAGGVELMYLNNAGLTVNGVFMSASDRNQKEHFSSVNPRELLAKVVGLPITTWNYKQDTSTRHLGPMAQDFYAAFVIGSDDKHIATVDADGVALAAIQGVHEIIKEQGSEIKRLRSENSDLAKRLAALEKLVSAFLLTHK